VTGKRGRGTCTNTRASDHSTIHRPSTSLWQSNMAFSFTQSDGLENLHIDGCRDAGVGRECSSTDSSSTPLPHHCHSFRLCQPLTITPKFECMKPYTATPPRAGPYGLRERIKAKEWLNHSCVFSDKGALALFSR
jgi:hypothetical protein